VAIQSLPISIRGVRKRYGGVAALDDVSLDIAAGEFVTLLGPSGSGKTTLLNILAGFIRLNSGQVFFGKDDVTLVPPHKRNVGLVFQNYALFPHMSVAENVAFPLNARRVPKAEIAERVKRALALVKLDGFQERGANQLSGGQRQRVALARAVVFEPKIILMDEPLSALDKQLREHMQIELRHLHETLGATTVYVTHDQREALTMADRVAVLNEGKLVQLGAPRELYEHPSSAFVAEFVGESTLLPVRRRGGNSVALDDAEFESARPLPAGENLLLVVRAEKLIPGASGQRNVIRGRVREVVFQGESLAVFVELKEGKTVLMRRPSHHESLASIPQAGQETLLSLPPESTIVVPAA
jgi:putative spermidine/putrescine transport system ATP-binding protein